MDGVALLLDIQPDDTGSFVLGFKCAWRNRATGASGVLSQSVSIDWTSTVNQIQNNVTAVLKQAMAEAAGVASFPNNGRFKLLGI